MPRRSLEIKSNIRQLFKVKYMAWYNRPNRVSKSAFYYPFSSVFEQLRIEKVPEDIAYWPGKKKKTIFCRKSIRQLATSKDIWECWTMKFLYVLH